MDLVVKASCFCTKKKSLKLSGGLFKIELTHNYELIYGGIE